MIVVQGTKTMHKSFMNALRESVITGVSTLAIDSVKIELNLSPLDDYVLQSTLALIPLQYPRSLVRQMRYVDECDEDECAASGSCRFCSIPFRFEFAHTSVPGDTTVFARATAKHIQIQSDQCRVAPEAMDQLIALMTPDQVIRV